MFNAPIVSYVRISVTSSSPSIRYAPVKLLWHHDFFPFHRETEKLVSCCHERFEYPVSFRFITWCGYWWCGWWTSVISSLINRKYFGCSNECKLKRGKWNKEKNSHYSRVGGLGGFAVIFHCIFFCGTLQNDPLVRLNSSGLARPAVQPWGLRTTLEGQY